MRGERKAKSEMGLTGRRGVLRVEMAALAEEEGMLRAAMAVCVGRLACLLSSLLGMSTGGWSGGPHHAAQSCWDDFSF